ncbi:MAG: chemotaxis protein CheA [Desulfovibrio sp.]|nr:chemotaxis protein CheA [Desulfovibrio sp.]
MSQEFFDPELITDFIAAAKAHLETIEPNLLELEKTPDNLTLLNDIFRPMHSLKGASGFLGLNRINHLAHKSENILDELRKGTMQVTSEIMDVILSSTDALRQMIDNLENSNTEGDVETESIIEQIDALMAGESLTVADPASGEENSETSAEEESGQERPEDDNPIEAQVIADEPIPDAAVEAPQKNRETKQGMSGKDWVNSLPQNPPYALTAFGEGHLKDFIDESVEIIESLNTGLLELEENPSGRDDLVNDLFRYFHNMKGNSGIIGYNELNSLTHEAETLLNNVRQGKISPSHELIDLLLLAVDVMEALVQRINVAEGQATPLDISPAVKQLKLAQDGEIIALPPELLDARTAAVLPEEDPAQAPVEVVNPQIIPSGHEEDDAAVFKTTFNQQMEIIKAALATLRKDGSHKESIDALYRCLIAIRNASGFVGQNDLKIYADRTAGIVDQGRKTGLDFSLMVDMLDQEAGIIDDMAQKAISDGIIGQAPEPARAKTGPKPEEKPKQDKPKESAPKKESKPAAKVPEKVAPKPAEPKSPAPAAKPAAAPAEAHKSSSTIRVDHERLDHLMNLIGELIINRNRYTLIARSLEGNESSVNIAEVAQSLSETTYAMARISDDLQDTIMKVRMVPVSSVFSRFPRLVRDLSKKSGKEVDLIMEGEETELDKSVVEVIGDPLVHLIRNSVDHGIEPEEQRIAAGKPPKGRVTLRAFHKGNSVAIEIEDDGKGIDPAKMREVAIKKGIITPEEAAQMDDREAIELIFAPGFSSAEKITDISGRGVGMDVVRTNIKNLKGSVSTFSELGKGTRFTLSLPLTLAIIDALMVNVSGQMYAIPLDAVSETTKIETVRLTDVKGRKAVTLRGEVLGIVELSEMLGVPRLSESLPEVLSVVVIHDNERRLGLVVDQLLERQEIVIKPLGAYLGDLKGISGATIMGDGSVILILDPHEIYTMATSKASGITAA